MTNSSLLINLFSTMKRLRLVEEEIALKYNEGKMRCPTHLSIGQELTGALTNLFLNKNDYAVSTHRSHIHYLGKGGSLKSMIAEIYGKVTGCARGRGGSMHLIDEDVCFMGSTAIVGNSIPIGAGLSLALKLDNSKRLSCIYLGDGATEEGVFFEAINFCAVKETPALFICENNLYSVYSPLSVRQPKNRQLSKMVEGIDIKSFHADSRDLESCIIKFQKAVNFVRNKRKPAFIEISAYRWREHCGPNFDNNIGYREQDEFLEWKKNDPLDNLEKHLVDNKILDKKDYSKIILDIEKEIKSAFEFAEKSPYPEIEEALIDEFAV